jgi:hydroxymethylglutaryl-CoA lyase
MKQLARPKQVVVHDTTVREGFQRKERLIPTSAKLWIMEQLILTGFRRLEVTNFANPKRLPQFADAEELLRLIRTQRSIARCLPSGRPGGRAAWLGRGAYTDATAAK